MDERIKMEVELTDDHEKRYTEACIEQIEDAESQNNEKKLQFMFWTA